MVCVKYIPWVCIKYFKVCLNWSAVSHPATSIISLMWDRGLFITVKAISKWQHIYRKFKFLASYRQLASAAGACLTWQLPKETFLILLHHKIEKRFIVVVRK